MWIHGRGILALFCRLRPSPVAGRRGCAQFETAGRRHDAAGRPYEGEHHRRTRRGHLRITRTLRKRIGRRSRLIALELHGSSASCLRRKFRDVVVVGGSAEHLRHHLDRLGHRYADCNVSGLPWSNMSGDLQNRILDAVLTRTHRQIGQELPVAFLAAVRRSFFGSVRNYNSALSTYPMSSKDGMDSEGCPLCRTCCFCRCSAPRDTTGLHSRK